MLIARMARYALKSYQLQALDFVMKPISYPVFSAKLCQMAAQLERWCGDGQRDLTAQRLLCERPGAYHAAGKPVDVK